MNNNKSQRIKTEVGTNADKHLKIKLDNQTEFLEILSLNIDQKDIYQSFNADYGVLVGRVLANGGVGIPNAKISIFIPITEEDQSNSDIKAIYPYETPRDKNADGKRYNLLPRVSTLRPDGTIQPKQPFGSFPIKEEIVTNETLLEVYDRYYKFSTVTNNSGDYMFFGVPVGTQTVHMSVDITDIGRFSMTPASLVTNLGYSPNLFTDNGSRIKPSNDLNDLPNIETQEISVDIIPFWGDTENFTIGITRQDFRIRAELVSTFTIFGTAFTDGDNSMWGANFDGGRDIRELYRLRDNENINIGMISKRIGQINEVVYSYPARVSDTNIDSGNVNTATDIIVIDQSEYSRFIRNGDFVFIVSCNRNKIITNEQGEDVPVPDDSPDGVFTKFRGFMTVEYTEEELSMSFDGDIGNNTRIIPRRYKLKIPQNAERNHSFTSVENADTDDWRKQHFNFDFGKIYSVARFHGNVFNDENRDSQQEPNNGFSESDIINSPWQRDAFWSTGIIATDDTGDFDGNEQFEMVSNSETANAKIFGANWLNFCIYLMQNGYLINGTGFVDDYRSNTNFTQEFKTDHFYENNSQLIAGSNVNTINLARSDLHYTDFIEVPKEDILLINASATTKGFKDNDLPAALIGDYRNGNSLVPENGGRINGDATAGVDPRTYFYKGFDSANCIEFIVNLGLI